jgi:hypothetical protein
MSNKHKPRTFESVWQESDGRHVIPHEEGNHAEQAARWAWNERGKEVALLEWENNELRQYLKKLRENINKDTQPDQ